MVSTNKQSKTFMKSTLLLTHDFFHKVFIYRWYGGILQECLSYNTRHNYRMFLLYYTLEYVKKELSIHQNGLVDDGKNTV